MNWSVLPPADNQIDAGADFLNNNNNIGWTGGGVTSQGIGWIHKTTDGGNSWSTRLHNFSYPINAIKFFNENTGYTLGGNVIGVEGGIFLTTDGGSNWNEEINTSANMVQINVVDVNADSLDLWCVGSTGNGGGYTGKAYKKRIKRPLVGSSGIDPVFVTVNYFLYQNYPNPFNPVTLIRYNVTSDISRQTSNVILKVFNISGNEIATLVNQRQGPGNYSVSFDGSNFSAGIYFYRLETNGYKETRKMVLVK